MDATTATDFITANKGSFITLTLTDDTHVDGFAFSVNSKGVNVKDDDGKTRSVSLSRIASMDLDDADYDGDADGDSDDDDAAADLDSDLNDILDGLSDGATTAELADALSDYMKITLTPKELRVHLRALGLGVGKGRKYALSAGEFRAVHGLILADA